MNFWWIRRQIHPAWLVAVLCLSFSVGIFSAAFIKHSYFSSTAILLGAAVIIFVIFKKRFVYLVPLLILSGLSIGIARGSAVQSDLEFYKSIYHKNISIQGLIKDDVDLQSPGQMTIKLDNLKLLGRNVPGSLWVTASPAEIKRGDEIIVSGKLQEGFGNYAGTIYRANIDKIIRPNPGDVGRVARDWFSDGIKKAISEPAASLGIGYLVGQRRSLPADLITALQVVGLTHIVVASGYNLTILVRFVRRIFMPISKYTATLVSFLTIGSFLAIAGMSPSMVRAGIVAILSLLAWYYGRKFHPIILLSIAIAITLLINPSYAWGDLGWQLSFVAFAGVMIIAPLSQRYFFGENKPGVIQQVLGETISAQIATAPIIIYAFGQISNVAVVSNLLVLPLIPVAMMMTFIAGLGGLFAPTLAGIIGLPASWLLNYSINVINYFAALPWASSAINLNVWGVVVCYLVIAAACFYMWRKTGYNLRETNLVE